jgi:hypothetical protein
VPDDRVDAAVKAISADLPYYKRSPATQLVLPNSSCPADFPDIRILKYPPLRIGRIPGQIAECMRPENAKRFLDKFVDSGKFQLREDSDDDVEDSGWEDDEDSL